MSTNVTLEQVRQTIETHLVAGEPEKAQEFFSQLSENYPFALQPALEPLSTWLRARGSFLSQVHAFRHAARINNESSRRVIVAAMPKSGSSLMQRVLVSKGGQRRFTFDHLASGLHRQFSALGNNGQEQDIDESALWKACIMHYDWISQRHLRASDFSDNILDFYNIKVIVTIRNIFDCLVSARDMYLAQNWKQVAWFTVPNHFREMNESEQLDWLIFHQAQWYLNFFERWVNSRLTHKLFIHYMEWDQTGVEGIVNRLSDFLGIEEEERAAFMSSTQEIKASKTGTRFNKGEHGRGKIFSRDQIEYVRRMATLTNRNIDWSLILDFDI